MIVSFNSIAIFHLEVENATIKINEGSQKEGSSERHLKQFKPHSEIYIFTRNIFSSLSPSNTNARVQRVFIYLQLLIGNIYVFNGGSFIQQSEIFDARDVLIPNRKKIEAVKYQRIT